jgi:hypothetical protein
MQPAQRMDRQIPLLLLGAVLAGCGETTGSSPLPPPPPLPPPSLTITDLSPRAVPIGQSPTFVISFRVEAPAGIRGSNGGH